MVLISVAAAADNAFARGSFQEGVEAYRAGEYMRAADAFREYTTGAPAAGAFQNLGNAEWQRGRTGPAILAWEQALWLDPFNARARNNLRLARTTAQIEEPNLTWYEAPSTWLPASWWTWLTGVSLWIVGGALVLPVVLRRRKAGWHQALAALGIALLLLSLPAHVALHTRARLGFVLNSNTPLRLTPTQDAQAVTRLPAGKPVRLQRHRGDYCLVRTDHGIGWVERGQIGLVCPK